MVLEYSYYKHEHLYSFRFCFCSSIDGADVRDPLPIVYIHLYPETHSQMATVSPARRHHTAPSPSSLPPYTAPIQVHAATPSGHSPSGHSHPRHHLGCAVHLIGGFLQPPCILLHQQRLHAFDSSRCHIRGGRLGSRSEDTRDMPRRRWCPARRRDRL